MFAFGQASKGGHRLAHERTDAPVRQVSSKPGGCKWYLMIIPDSDPVETVGRLAEKQMS